MRFNFSKLLFIILIVGCGRQQTDSEIALIELQRQFQQLQTRYAIAESALEELSNPSGQVNFLEAQIISEPVEFWEGGDTLQAVRDRGLLRCGGNADVPGFGFLDSDLGQYTGFDIDFCRAIASAIFGTDGAENFEVTPLTSRLRFPSLQSGEIDLLVRNTTHTFARDTTLGVDFAPVTFYDGQGILVRSSSGVRRLSDMAGRVVCVQASSTSVLNLQSYYDEVGIEIEILQFDDRIGARDQYERGTCDGFTGDKSSLLAQRSLLGEPDDHFILVEDISREPLAPAVRHGDDNWSDLVTWSVQCMFNGELLGVTQANVDEMSGSDEEAIQILLGVQGELGISLGLGADFCYQIIKQVGNYADVYNRHLGPDTQFDLARGLNALYIDGGIIYPMPFR